MNGLSDMKRSCARVQARLPLVVDGSLRGPRRRLLLRHVGRCDDCAVELDRQLAVAEGLRDLGGGTSEPGPEPPDELLDAILKRVNDPGLRARVAAPARGAVSGARPELSFAGLLVALLIVYLVWRLGRAMVDRVGDP